MKTRGHASPKARKPVAGQFVGPRAYAAHQQRKRGALRVVKLAGSKLFEMPLSICYSCSALVFAGGEFLKPQYAEWFLFGCDWTTVNRLLRQLGLRPPVFPTPMEDTEDFNQRLIMLAMFHALIEAGDIKP